MKEQRFPAAAPREDGMVLPRADVCQRVEGVDVWDGLRSAALDAQILGDDEPEVLELLRIQGSVTISPSTVSARRPLAVRAWRPRVPVIGPDYRSGESPDLRSVEAAASIRPPWPAGSAVPAVPFPGTVGDV